MEARAVRARAAMVFVVFLGEINRRRLRTVIYTLYCMCGTEYDVKVRVVDGQGLKLSTSIYCVELSRLDYSYRTPY